MTLPSSGRISLSDVNNEMGRGTYNRVDLDDSGVRRMFQRETPQSLIAMSNGWGKANEFRCSFGGGYEVNLRNTALSLGWNGSSHLVITNVGNCYTHNTGAYALYIVDGFPGGVEFINNGNIIGAAGGGAGRASGGGSGGHALYCNTYCLIANYGTIGGGGGGGGGGGKGIWSDSNPGGGGQGANIDHWAGYGGGNGSNTNIGGAGGAGGGGGQPGNNGGGGGTGATGSSGGGGGGGGLGSAGGAGGAGLNLSGGAQEWGGGGGAGGYAVIGNGYISWAYAGARYGGIG